MSWRLLAAILLLTPAVLLAAKPPPPVPGPVVMPAAPSPAIKTDEQLLKNAGLPTDGPGLVKYFHRRAVQDMAADRIKELVRQLGDDDFELREKASAGLIDLRQRAVPFLLHARSSSEPEVAQRARDCLRAIGGEFSVGLDAAAIRILASHKAAGTAGALLAFLAVADTDLMIDEVIDGLVQVARPDGRPDQVLVAALGDRLPIRRAAAAVALCRSGALAQEPAIRKAVQDADPSVQLRAGLVLAAAGEKKAVAVLIDLLTRASMEGAWEAEDCLLRLAKGTGPDVPLKLDADSRKKCREAWAGWWARNQGTADLTKLKTAGAKGITLVILLDEGKVREIDAKGKTLWEVKEIEFPLDAQPLPGDRVLVAEHGTNSVNERDRTGKVVWKKQLATGPLAAHRLADGNTFIATGAQMIEVDKDGKEIRQYVLPNGDSIRKAKRLRNGDVGCISTGNRFVRLGRDGKEVLSFPVEVATNGGRIDVLANGHVLVPQMNQNKVIEYNAEGKPVWEATVQQPIAAVRLPNGHTLVTSLNEHRAVELDRSGRAVWDYRSNTRVTRAFRR